MSPESERLNVVFILTDDQGPWAMGCAGNEEIRTPSLDALAGKGVRFENFFCTSPVCSPARASLMTGTIPSRHGVHDWIRHKDEWWLDGAARHGVHDWIRHKDEWWLDGADRARRPVAFLEDMTCYTDVLAANGYVCGLSGKWHLGDALTPQHGFSHWFCHPKGSGRYNDMEMIRDGRVIRTSGYVTDVITDDALGFLAANADRPFYLSVHYTAPHAPWTGHPQEIVDSYDDCPFKSCPQEAMHPWAIGLSKGCLGNREMLKGYFAAVTAMDANVGRILAKLDELGLRDKTLVIFMGDNGFSCGHHGFWGKGNGTRPLNMYENSVKVPAIFSHPPRLAEGRVTQALISQYDLFPTLLEYLSLPAPDDASLPGASFVPVLEARSEQARDDVVVYDEYGPVRMIRTPEWKYVHRYPGGPHELYRLTDDPDERRNVVDDKGFHGTVVEMRRRLARWFARYVDPRKDGARLGVTGRGQTERIDDAHCGEEAFGTEDD